MNIVDRGSGVPVVVIPGIQGRWEWMKPGVDALARRGIDVDRHKIDLEEPLKTLGTSKVAIQVFSGMTPEVTIVVEPKGDTWHVYCGNQFATRSGGLAAAILGVKPDKVVMRDW